MPRGGVGWDCSLVPSSVRCEPCFCLHFASHSDTAHRLLFSFLPGQLFISNPSLDRIDKRYMDWNLLPFSLAWDQLHPIPGFITHPYPSPAITVDNSTLTNFHFFLLLADIRVTKSPDDCSWYKEWAGTTKITIGRVSETHFKKTIHLNRDPTLSHSTLCSRQLQRFQESKEPLLTIRTIAAIFTTV